jgi:uncharacterized protein (DUF1697 family)
VSDAAPTYIALLRGINVSGRNSIRMTELRALCHRLGWRDVQTYIQSGNVVFRAENATAARLEQALERAIERDWGLSVPTLVRSAAEWRDYTRENPFPAESRNEPNRVMIAVSKARPLDTAVEELRRRAASDERVARVGDALWVFYAGGAGRSKLSPAVFDRAVGSAVTARNWRTAVKLEEMSRAAME